MIVSSYPRVAERLVDLLSQEFPHKVTVARGGFVKGMQADAILIGGVEDGNHTYPVSRPGRKPRDERYKLIVNIHSVVPGQNDPAKCEIRGYELMAALEDFIANDPGLGMQEPTLRCNLEDFESDLVLDDTGWRCIIVAKVLVHVRLS